MEQGKDVRPRVDLGWDKMAMVLDSAMPVRRDRRWIFILLLLGLMLAILLLSRLVGEKTKTQNIDSEKPSFAQEIERGTNEVNELIKDDDAASLGIMNAGDDEDSFQDIQKKASPLFPAAGGQNEEMPSRSVEVNIIEKRRDENMSSNQSAAENNIVLPVSKMTPDPRRSNSIENIQPETDSHIAQGTARSFSVEEKRISSLAVLPVSSLRLESISIQVSPIRSVPIPGRTTEPLAEKHHMAIGIDAGVDAAYFHNLSFPGLSTFIHMALRPTRRVSFGPVLGVGAARKVDAGQSGADDLAASSPDAGMANVDLSNEFSARYFESFYFLEAGLRASVMPVQKLSVSAGAGYMYILNPGFNTNSGRTAFEVLSQDAENTSGASFEFPEITYDLDRQWLPYGGVDIDYRISNALSLSAGYRVMFADVFEGTEDGLKFDRVRLGINVTIK